MTGLETSSVADFLERGYAGQGNTPAWANVRLVGLCASLVMGATTYSAKAPATRLSIRRTQSRWKSSQGCNDPCSLQPEALELGWSAWRTSTCMDGQTGDH
jgi:hypothetical protein